MVDKDSPSSNIIPGGLLSIKIKCSPLFINILF